ncbi:hypothetical protein HMPREF0496_0981 [Lentilactobacillus hilgardii ATCC 27305]|nr:hypothetical protein HMPREF0496_0981 [Lentilactobacillus hilgardii ATCC 27305]
MAQVGYTFKNDSINAWTGANGQGLYVYPHTKYKSIGAVCTTLRLIQTMLPMVLVKHGLR